MRRSSAAVYWYSRELYERRLRLYRQLIDARRRQRSWPGTIPGYTPCQLNAQTCTCFRGMVKLGGRGHRCSGTRRAATAPGPSGTSDHGSTLSSMNNLQSIYFTQSRYQEALPIAEEVLQTR